MKAIMRLILVADAHVATNGAFVQKLCQALCKAASRIIVKSTSPMYVRATVRACACGVAAT